MRRLLHRLMLTGYACITTLTLASTPDGRPSLPIGESLEYGIYWGVVPAGKTSIDCTATKDADRDLVSIRVRARSNWLASTIFQVNDDVTCLIDPETRLPIRVDKQTDEGEFICHDTLTFDRTENRAHWDSHSAKITTNYPISADALDAVSFLFAMRELPFVLNEPRNFSLAVDGQVHRIEVTAVRYGHHEIEELGKVRTTCFQARPHTEGLFVRKIPEEIWISDTEPRVVTKMTGRVPAGRFRMVLKKATPMLQPRRSETAAVAIPPQRKVL